MAPWREILQRKNKGLWKLQVHVRVLFEYEQTLLCVSYCGSRLVPWWLLRLSSGDFGWRLGLIPTFQSKFIHGGWTRGGQSRNVEEDKDKRNTGRGKERERERQWEEKKGTSLKQENNASFNKVRKSHDMQERERTIDNCGKAWGWRWWEARNLELERQGWEDSRRKVIKKPQVEIQGVKNTVFELENALDGTSSRSHTSRENRRHHNISKTLQNEEQRKETERKQQKSGPWESSGYLIYI